MNIKRIKIAWLVSNIVTFIVIMVYNVLDTVFARNMYFGDGLYLRMGQYLWFLFGSSVVLFLAIIADALIKITKNYEKKSEENKQDDNK